MINKWMLCLLLVTVSCEKKSKTSVDSSTYLKENPQPLGSFERPKDSKPILIENVKIMTASGETLDKASLLMAQGLIKEVSTDKITPTDETLVIDGTGLTLTPGLIDVHSHMGVYSSPSVDGHEDGNEMSRPVTSDVWAEHAFWPQDPDLWRALDGGVTTIQVLPGSGNLIGGRSFTAQLIPKVSAREMRFEGAPQGLKMACGENPKRTHRDKGVMTRMGNMAQFRKAFQEALEYKREWSEFRSAKGKSAKIPKRNFVSETLMQVMDGQILVHFHCYRADDISAILDLAQEFGFKIHTIHHGLEAYKVADRLAKENVGVATWADWWGFKAEAYDGIPFNLALIEKSGAKAIVHSDSAKEIRYLNIEAAKALSSARKIGLDFTDDQALSWITKNAAWSLGIDDKVGTIEEGKIADVVLWDGNPFSIYTKTQMVFINGKLILDRKNKKIPSSDFELGFENSVFDDGRDFVSIPVKTPPSESSEKEKTDPIKATLFQFPSVYNEKDFSIQSPENLSKGLLIENARAFIKGQWLEQQTLLIQNGNIVELNPKNPPSQFARLNAQGLWLSPGLIESSSQLGLFEITLDSRAQDLFTNSSLPSPDYQAMDALNAESIRIPIRREEGVTTAISHLDGDIAAGFSVAFDLNPQNPKAEKNALFGSLEKNGWGRGPKKTRPELWSRLRNLVNESSFYIKNRQAYLSGQTQAFTFARADLEAFSKVLSGEVPWVLEAHRASDLRKIMALKKNLKSQGHSVNLIIKGASEAWLVADELKEALIPVIITPSDQTPTDFNKTRARFDLATFLDQKGVEFIIVDTGDLGGSRLRQEAGIAVRYGLNPNQALKSITETPAKIFNLEGGQILAGQKANLILWSGDPLEPTSRAEKIWIHGEEMSLKTRQKALALKYLRL